MEIGIPLDAKLLLSVGELSVRKNHKVVVETLQELPDEYWYVIVGKGVLKNTLERMDHTGRLKLIGFRTDIVDILHAADLFIFPSLQEGLPVALMEALSTGLICIASNIRGNEDLLSDDERGYLIIPPDHEKYYRQIMDLDTNNAIYSRRIINNDIIKRIDIRTVEKMMASIYSLN